MVPHPGAAATLATNGAGKSSELRPEPPLVIVTGAQFWSEGQLYTLGGEEVVPARVEKRVLPTLTHFPVANLVEPSPAEDGLAAGGLLRDRNRLSQAVDNTSADDRVDDVPRLPLVVRQDDLTGPSAVYSSALQLVGDGVARSPRCDGRDAGVDIALLISRVTEDKWCGLTLHGYGLSPKGAVIE